MAEHTKIQWTDATFNPWWGCTKISPGCDHCYAEEIARRCAIESAELIDSATEAVQLLQNEGFGDHLTTLKLAAALERDAAKRNLKEAA